MRKSVARLDGLPTSIGCCPRTVPRSEIRKASCASIADKLERLEKLYLRGYDPEARFRRLSGQGFQTRPSSRTCGRYRRTCSSSSGPNFWPNFSLILSDNGHALLSDCGLLDEQFLDTALEGMRQHFGLKAIDAIVVSHMHGDHFLEAPHLREKWGAQIWALDNMVDKMEHPERFDYAAPIQAYGKKSADGSRITGVRVDRAFKSGETFEWEGTSSPIDWMPGQTEFALCLHGEIDGRKVAFTGDNIFGDPDDPTQTGHEAMVAHNSAILEEGYIYGAEYLKRLKPDLLMGGHSFVMDHPAAVHRALPQVVLRDARRVSGAQFGEGLPLLVRSVLGACRTLSRNIGSWQCDERDIARPQLSLSVARGIGSKSTLHPVCEQTRKCSKELSPPNRASRSPFACKRPLTQVPASGSWRSMSRSTADATVNDST